MWRFAFLFLAGLFAAASPAAAQIDSLPKVHVRLIAERDTVAPGSTVTVALEENIREGWHTYWINPGDAGAPTEIQWTLPQGWRADPIQWPYPGRLPVPPFMNYGYEGTVWLLAKLHVPADAPPGDVTLKAAANWLVCKEVCVPEDTTLTLPLHVGGSQLFVDRDLIARFAAARAKLPVMSPWPLVYRLGNTLDLFVASPQLASARPTAAEFFPFASGEIKSTAQQSLGFASGGLVLRMTPSKKFKGGATLSGVLVLTSSDGSVSALEVHARPGVVPATEFANESGMTLALALFFALLGGLILNLMPCVLPVLAMKALALADHAHGDAGASRREGLAYGVGAILSFAVFGLALVILRAGGAAIGWGFQLQEPIVVAGFALLMFAVGLNLSGLYEVSPVAAGDGLTRRGGAVGAFFTGVLAVAVAAPCTAPFMAAALGFALAQSELVALLVFVALGVGFALPFLLLGFFPALARILPKPGAWMMRLRQALAFPMYGAAVWLVWVLAQQTGAIGVGAALAAMVVLAFALWLYDATRSLSATGRAVGALAALLALVGALSLLTVLRTPSTPALSAIGTSIPSEPYTAARLDELRKEGRPVFVDATAAWCITCLVNEKAVLSQPDVKDAFAKNNVAYLVADWTNRNAEVSALLDAHGRSGVPLYLYYAPRASDAKILPQVLTASELMSVLGH
jgi:thiol:disulfide interchange protein DsbD